jgi:recombinase
MSEAELHVLKARLRGGILNKVRRGEYRCPLPTGFVYDEAGNVVLDPDAQTREAVGYFFETFLRVGSASQTMKVFRKEGLVFPSRLRNGDTTVFRPLTASAVMRTLNNPRYAGAYVYGRRRYRRAADDKKIIQRKREYDEWLACIPNAHPGYISWERFSRKPQGSRDQRSRIRSGTRIAAARRGGATTGTSRLRSLWTKLPRSICHVPGRAGSLVCLRSGDTARMASRTANRSPQSLRQGPWNARNREHDAGGCRASARNPTRDPGSVRRGRSAS